MQPTWMFTALYLNARGVTTGAMPPEEESVRARRKFSAMEPSLGRTIGALAVLAFLTACGGEHAQPGAMPQTPTGASSSSDLLYVSDESTANVYLFSYPAGQLVGTLTGLSFPEGLCVDRLGDVFVADPGAGQISEYAHGGTDPINTLKDSHYPDGCAVDPTTGNLAVVNESGNVSVYQNSTGEPTIYSTAFVPWFCTYDTSGNLFADGSNSIAELPKGGSTFQAFDYDGHYNGQPAGLQWVDRRLTVGSVSPYERSCCGRIYRFRVKDTHGRAAGHMLVRGAILDFFIEGSTAITVSGGRAIGLFDYPGGGHVKKVIKEPGDQSYSVVVSAAASLDPKHLHETPAA